VSVRSNEARRRKRERNLVHLPLILRFLEEKRRERRMIGLRRRKLEGGGVCCFPRGLQGKNGKKRPQRVISSLSTSLKEGGRKGRKKRGIGKQRPEQKKGDPPTEPVSQVSAGEAAFCLTNWGGKGAGKKRS